MARYCPECGNRPARTGAAPAYEDHCGACGHVDHNNPAPATSGICLRDGQVLLAKRARPPHEGAWDLPGGFVHAGEGAADALRREWQEETGLSIRVGELVAAAAGDYGGRPTLTLIYRVEAEGHGQAADDVAELRWWPLEERPRLCWPHEEAALAALGGL